MAISARTRTKGVAASQKLLPDARVVGYAIGRSGQHPVLVGGGMVGLFVVLMLVLLASTDTLFFPGVVPLLVLQHLISPPRGLAITDRGVALTKRSVWTGRPNGIVTRVPFGEVVPTKASLGRVHVVVGTEEVWLATREDAELRTAVATTLAHPPSA